MKNHEPLVFHSVLLVEDEFNLAQTLRLSLKTMGVEEIVVASTLEDARKSMQAKNNNFDLVLLDRNLPDGEGLHFCSELRAASFVGSILILTANGLVEEKVKGLDSGADDYLAKPFSWEELAARLRALGRRLPVRGSQKVVNESLWQIDETNLRVLGPKGWVELTPLEMKLFLNLYRAQGNTVSRDELLKNVWGFKWLPKTRTLDFFMTRLRRYFEPTPESPQHFITTRGVGFKFIA